MVSMAIPQASLTLPASSGLYAKVSSAKCNEPNCLHWFSLMSFDFLTPFTNNSSFQNYPHPDDHTIRTTFQFVFQSI